MRVTIVAAGMAGLAGVLLGAARAHIGIGDGGREADTLIDLAARYLLIHAAALIGLAALEPKLNSLWLALARPLMALGLAVFAGGLTILAFTGWRTAALATPIGGSLLILAWTGILVAGLTAPRR